MSTTRSKSVARPKPDPHQPLRVVVVNREAFLLTYVWHLTGFFERVCPARLRVWESWSYSDIAQPLGMAAASEAVHVANWVVFCQATPMALPSHVRRWVESWRSHERKAQGWLGFFSITGNDAGLQDNAQTCLRKLARKANRRFVAIWDYLRGEYKLFESARDPALEYPFHRGGHPGVFHGEPGI